MLQVLIDSRETLLSKIIYDRGLDKYEGKIKIDIQQLDIGDVHICNDDKTFVIERKTISDLLSSIKDGRYHEQKSRLLASGFDITYVIEGDDIISSSNLKNQNLLSSIYLHTMYRDNIKVIFTKNTDSTATFILTLCTKIIDNPSHFIEPIEKIQKDYIDCVKIKTKKSQNITPNNCFMMQLGQIPSISSKIAMNIQSNYKNMRELIKALDDANDKIELLCKIDLIGKDKAKRILQYFDYIDDK